MRGTGPLSDLTVVELTVHRAAPFCGALLADMGADVIKVERPGVGDPARSQGVGPDGKSAYFMVNNRNKKSVTLDLKSEAGQEAVLELLADADVFIENFSLGVPERLGVGYEDVRAVNDDIIYASIKGYGKTGPLKEKKGLDLILQAEGGIMSVTGPEGGDPVKVGQALGDLNTGLLTTIGILARLYERERTGEGGEFDVGLYDAVVSFLNEYITNYSMTGDVPGPQGTSHQTSVPYQLFETKDSHIVTGVGSDERWGDFVEAIGREELADYPTNADRVEQQETVVSIIQEEFRAETTDYWLDRLTEYGFPNGPMNNVEDVVENEQSEARGLVEEHDDPDWGECLMPGHPIHFPDHDTSIRSPAPRLGDDVDEVFGAVADEEQVEAWREGGAFGDDR
ncbi:CaiB/BaiF CoA transferase family protein [Haloplanus natans]|uniref:CaiB/BaiF CoA transferase family protein n=1 Tax=Haloplanus natans TaxID=376171 RepID=UPI000677E021|nr:CoA transferase [Haloplanus natans]